MIRLKKEKPKYPDEKFAQRISKKLLTLAGIVSGSSVFKSEFFCSYKLLAQN